MRRVIVFFNSVMLVILFMPTVSYADRHDHHDYHHHDYHHYDHSHFSFGLSFFPDRYYYDSYDYDPYYYDREYVSPTVINTTPSFQPVSMNGTTYYLNNGNYYIYTSEGYQPVTPPQTAPTTTTTPTTVDSQEVFTINVPNDQGGYTPVTIKRSDKGFVGPQGEYYSQFPTIAQLKVMYGKK